ncbi:MAG: twitch domain-containing radical SAM protein [Iamia sp.]
MGVRDVLVELRRDARRGSDRRRSACNAPFSSMYLDQHGSVRACCQNVEHPLGNVQESTLREIWEGAQAASLRQAMVDHDLDHGCGFCKWQVAEGNEGLVFARTFDHLKPESSAPEWPRQLELSMSNACNLQCEMCNGDWSSSIRTHREGKPPLPQVYDDAFFEQLLPFLEQVEVVKILGGEPFLGRESLRVMEMLIESGSTAEVHVTTNGTQWSPRIQRILERLPMVIILSLDGVDAPTYEAIRIGADFNVVLENLDRFRSYADDHGTSVNLAHCLMSSNWAQFPDFLRFAEERSLRAYVNTVTYPNSLSLFHQPPSVLRTIIDAYEAVDEELSGALSLNRALWKDQLHRLQHRLAGLEEGKGVDYYLGVMGFPFVAAGVASGVGHARSAGAAAAGDSGQVTVVRIDIDARIGGVIEGPDEILGVDVAGVAGRDVEALLEALGARHGAVSVANPPLAHEDVRQWRLSFADDPRLAVSVFVSPHRDADGVLADFEAHFAVEAVGDAEPRADIDELIDGFRREHPGLHELVVGADGRVTEVTAGPSELGRTLASLAGTRADEMMAALEDALGVAGTMEETPVDLDGAVRYSVRFRDGAGMETGIEAMVLPSPTRDLGPAGSRILVAQPG